MTVINIEQPRDMARVRRIALAAQGLLQARPFAVGLDGAREAIEHIGYVQIDTISVVERAHHHILHTRVPAYKPEMLSQMLLDRDIFEYWTHAAAFIPITDFRFSLPYKEAIKGGKIHWYKNPDKKLMGDMLAQITSDGPLRSRDLETTEKKRSGWWDLKPAKRALEQLYMQGDLMVSNRDGFQKTYDLTERVLPSKINLQLPTTEEFATHMVDQQLRCHGLVSLKGFTYLRKNTELRNAVKLLVNERLALGTLEKLKLSNGEIFFIKPGELERPQPRLNQRMVILSPFDNSVIQRDRIKTLFEYDYQIECYVPAAKRQYGYFSLPLLYRDGFAGRMDCKAHRKDAHLEIKALYLELEKGQLEKLDMDLLIDALLKSVKRFSRFQACRTVSISKVNPNKLTRKLKRALRELD